MSLYRKRAYAYAPPVQRLCCHSLNLPYGGEPSSISGAAGKQNDQQQPLPGMNPTLQVLDTRRVGETAAARFLFPPARKYSSARRRNNRAARMVLQTEGRNQERSFTFEKIHEADSPS